MRADLTVRKIISKVLRFPISYSNIKAVDMIMLWRTTPQWLIAFGFTERFDKGREGFCFNLHPAYEIKSCKRRHPLPVKEAIYVIENSAWQ